MFAIRTSVIIVFQDYILLHIVSDMKQYYDLPREQVSSNALLQELLTIASASISTNNSGDIKLLTSTMVAAGLVSLNSSECAFPIFPSLS